MVFFFFFTLCRSLEHSTILYEAPSAAASPSATSNFASVISDGSQPLLRLQFNRINHDLLATFRMDSDTVQILDIRYPSAPVAELTRSHRSSVNCFSWSPNHPGHICTGGKFIIIKKTHGHIIDIGTLFF